MINAYLVGERGGVANDEFGPVGRIECGKGQLEAADQIVRVSIQIGDQDRAGVRLKKVSRSLSLIVLTE